MASSQLHCVILAAITLFEKSDKAPIIISTNNIGNLTDPTKTALFVFLDLRGGGEV